MMILAVFSSLHSLVLRQSLVLRHAPPRACAVDSVSVASVRRALAESEARVADAAALLDLPRMREAVEELEARSSAPGFWDDADQAEETLRVLNDRRASLEQAAGWAVALEDARAAIELAEAEADADAEDSLLPEALAALEALGGELGAWERRALLDGEHDACGAVLTVLAGSGGVDAQDWAEMLLRMYTRWAERQPGARATLTERTDGEEAGIKSATLTIDGEYAYGLLRSERGTHRLVRLSPFNAANKRQTSFAGVELMPLLRDDALAEVEIPPSDLEVSTMRSGGAGGQNVNKVESAVRMVHVPSGLTVRCEQERSQGRNKELALQLLKAKLLVAQRQQRVAELAEIKGDLVKAEWGQQIRSYVLAPYKMVKDLRTACETSQVDAVLDGGLAELIDAYLQHAARERKAEGEG